MNDKQGEKAPIVASKSFMAVGPTLHYSHRNVQRCWLLAAAVFALSCLFWSKILTGSFWAFDFQTITSPELWRLDRSATTGVSIFEYPWQILVLGLLMGILAIGPVLVSQLMSFSYSLPFVSAVFFLANLPAFAICLLIGCLGAACRPLRFRSRFTAIALCAAPQLLYWGYFGGARGVEPLKWGFSFAPWVCAWLIGLSIAGLVLGIGHFTRYRPGLVWIVTLIFLLLAVVTFEIRIGFDELDYQLYVAKNDPENVSEFHDHSITEALDETITNPTVRKYLAGFFYPAEPIPLRAELKREIQVQLSQGRWPSWFKETMPVELRFEEKKEQLGDQYDLFISKRTKSRRMPIALYYQALLSEYSPDIDMLGQKEILHFYSDYPFERSREIWWSLYKDFGESPESVEARWRIAKHWAGQGEFDEADECLAEAQVMATERLASIEGQQTQSETLFSLFRAPPDSVMTKVKLEQLQRRLNQLRNLISSQNRADETVSADRLARFVMLNPHNPDYSRHLDELLEQMSDNDPLRDNILLAQTKLVADEQRRAERLAELHKKFADSDGGMQALYELGLLKIGQYQSESDLEQKKRYLADARATLTSFISLYPDSFCAEQVQKNLDDLPTVD
jgi:TolA-binding protein